MPRIGRLYRLSRIPILKQRIGRLYPLRMFREEGSSGYKNYDKDKNEV